MARNIRLYPWFQFCRSLIFWQGVWFLYFQSALSPAEAILLYAVYDIATTALEVPSGALSDRVGRRPTLILSTIACTAGTGALALGGDFWIFAAGQVLLGAGMALVSGTDSALLYESLKRVDREDEIEHHELVAWRASFAALAVSAVAGGAMALVDPALPYLTTTLAGAVSAFLAFAMVEERRNAGQTGVPPISQLRSVRAALSTPVLIWLFVLGLAMYVFSHVPFVFGQPFIQEALSATGADAEAPIISGTVVAGMMLVSIAVSWAGPGLRDRVGLAALLLFAFAMQIALCAVLAVSNNVLVIGVLLLRMVPDALSKAFVVARVQPLLADEGRATFLSIKSFAGRLVLAITMIGAAQTATGETSLSYPEIQSVLTWYAVGGTLILLGLAFSARRAGV